MPNIRINNTAPNIKNKNLVLNVRLSNVVPINRDFNLNPTVRVDSASKVTVIEGTTGGGSSFAGKGYLMGMMALPYIAAQVIAGATTMAVVYVGPKPNMRIQ